MNSNPTTTSSASTSVSADAISRRAYEIWESEGRPEGCDLRHWLQAEQELGITSGSLGASAGNGATTSAAPASVVRASETSSRNTDRPLSNRGTTGARDSKRSTPAPFERGPSSGGQPTGSKRR